MLSMSFHYLNHDGVRRISDGALSQKVCDQSIISMRSDGVSMSSASFRANTFILVPFTPRVIPVLVVYILGEQREV